MKSLIIVAILFMSLNVQAEGEKCVYSCPFNETCVKGVCEIMRDRLGQDVRPFGAKSCNTNTDCETGYCKKNGFQKYCSK